MKLMLAGSVNTVAVEGLVSATVGGLLMMAPVLPISSNSKLMSELLATFW